MTADNPMEKEMATERKDARKTQTEMDKQMAHDRNAAAREAATTGGQGRVPLHTSEGTIGAGVHHPEYGTGGTGVTGGHPTRDVKFGGTTNGGGI